MRLVTADIRFRHAALAFLFAGVIAVGFAGASARAEGPPDSAAQIPALAGSEWILYEIRDPRGTPIKPFSEQVATSRSILPIEFDAETLSFADGCGRFLAPYRRKGNEVVIGEFYRSVSSCSSDSDEARLVLEMSGISQASLRQGPSTDRHALVLETASGRTYVFYAGVAMRDGAGANAPPAQPEVSYRQFGPDTLPCREDPMLPLIDSSEPRPQCLAVRTVRLSGEGTWEAHGSPWALSRTLPGLSVQAGTRTVARILTTPVTDPDIHGPIATDALDMVMQQEQLSAGKTTRRNPSHRWIP